MDGKGAWDGTGMGREIVKRGRREGERVYERYEDGE